MLKTSLKLIFSLFFAPLYYIIVIPPLTLIVLSNECIRLAASIGLRFKKNISLCSNGRDGIWEYRTPGNTRMVIVSALTKRGQLDDISKCINYLEDRIFKRSSYYTKSENYDKLKHIMIKYCGYVCWKFDDNFAVKNHIRILNPDVEYSEQDHLNLLLELNKDMDESKPQWEMIILSKYTDSNGETKSCLIFRFHHAYMDGMSILMLFKKLSDNFVYTIDPLKFKIPIWKKMFFYGSCLIFGPITSIQMLCSRLFTHWKHKSLFPGSKKIYQWTKVISLEKLKKIRANTKASIPNIVSLAFMTSCKNILPRERLVNNFKVTELMAFLPYPNSKPQNRFSMFSYEISTTRKEKSLTEQLTKLHHDSTLAQLGPHALIYYYSMTLAGRLPYFLFPFVCYWTARESFILSNVPAPKNHFNVFETADCEELGAFPPVPTSTGIILASISYNSGIKICGQIDSACLSEEECRGIFEQIPLVINAMADGHCTGRVEKFNTNGSQIQWAENNNNELQIKNRKRDKKSSIERDIKQLRTGAGTTGKAEPNSLNTITNTKVTKGKRGSSGKRKK